MQTNDSDKDRPTDRILGMGAIIVIGVVPAVLAIVVAVVTITVVALCIKKKKWLIDYKLKCLAINNTEKYIEHLQEQIKVETRPDILKQLIRLMTVASERLLDPNTASLTPLVSSAMITTQTSVQSPMLREPSNTQSQPLQQVNAAKSTEADDKLSLEDLKHLEGGKLPPLSLRRTSMAEMETLEQNSGNPYEQLTNMFATFISKAVHDSLLHASDHNPRLAVKVEQEVRSAIIKRQQSIGSTRANGDDFLCTNVGCFGRSVSDCGRVTQYHMNQSMTTYSRQNTVL